jgi:hypothetical protein
VTRVAGDAGSLAVAGATLTAAAAFQPLRRRVQDLVNRRFNGQRHDAARTVEAFAVWLREQVDLNVLSAELLVPRPAMFALLHAAVAVPWEPTIVTN